MASTLTHLLRDLPDEALVVLVRARPDLVVPAPADLSALAARAQSRVSVARALDGLDRFHLEILDGLRLTRDPDGRTSLDEVLAVTVGARSRTPGSHPAGGGGEPAAVRGAVELLRAHLLVYGPDDALRVVAAVDEVCGPHPAGLGRPAGELTPGSAELVADPARLRRTVLSAPPAARAVLDRLAGGPPIGETTADPAADSPVGWLVSHGLLAATSPTVVELPREVGLLLRRDTGPLGAIHPAPPEPAAATVEPGAVDAAGAGQALSAVRHAEALLEALADEPAQVLRSGGLGVRDLRRLASAAGVDEPMAALLVETGYAAGLIGTGAEQDLRPAAGYDAWRTAPIAQRWHALAAGWLAMTRDPALVGQRDAKRRVIGALTPSAERSGAPTARRAALGVLAGLPPGTAASADEVLALLAWHAPRRAASHASGIRELLAGAAMLGVTGRGALTSYGSALLAETRAPAEPDDPLGVRAGGTPAGPTGPAAQLDALLPEPVGEVLVQADLTVVVPGPPEPALAAELELVAEHESAGGASVHRVTRDSVRRALDAGYSPEDLHALFARRSRTPVPQALTYLIDDLARTHGGLRVGSAGAYLRCDDEALVNEVLGSRRLSPLGLRRLAPSVLGSAATAGRVLAALREAGFAPVPEDASGATVLVRPRTRRAPARAPVTAPVDPLAAPRMSTPRLLGIIEDIRRGDAAARAARRAPTTVRANGRAVAGVAAAQAHTEALAILQQAVRDKALVWVGYMDPHGTTTSRLLRPVSIGAGYLRAEDERADTLHTFALHRIIGATLDA